MHITEEIIPQMNFTNPLEQQLKTYFNGKDVLSYTIGITCVSPQFDPFFKVNKPKYIEDKTETHDGFSVRIDKSYEYGIKLNHNKVLNASEEEVKKMLASSIMESLSHLDSLPRKIKDFDKEQFRADLESFFKDRQLI